jgi:hypothetical protein
MQSKVNRMYQLMSRYGRDKMTPSDDEISLQQVNKWMCDAGWQNSAISQIDLEPVTHVIKVARAPLLARIDLLKRMERKQRELQQKLIERAEKAEAEVERLVGEKIDVLLRAQEAEAEAAACRQALVSREAEISHAIDEVERLTDELATFRLGKHHQENERLRGLLRPLAGLDQPHNRNIRDDTPLFAINGAEITAGDVRAASAALKEQPCTAERHT